MFPDRWLDAGHLLHGKFCGVRTETHLAADPVGALAGDGALSEFIAESDLELGAVEAALAFELGDEKLALFLRQFVSRLAMEESGSGEDELNGVHLFQLCLERFIGVDGETGSRDLELGTGSDGAFQIVAKEAGDVVEGFHQAGGDTISGGRVLAFPVVIPLGRMIPRRG